MMMEGEEEQHGQDHGTVTTNTELQPKRTTSFASRLKNKKKPGPKPAGSDLIARITLEREKTKYWARLLLLFPLCPVIVALTTIVFGGVVINVATNKCNSMLMEFLQGAVVLSHLLVIFYAYSWMGPWPIKRLRTVRLAYFLYGFVCVIWWGIFGTLQAATATSTGFQSCLSSSPALYLMAHYEISVFWILFAIFIGFVVMEKTSKTREAKLNELKEKKLDVLRSKRKAEAQAREESLKAEQELARSEQDAEKKKLGAEQDQLFRNSEGDAANNQLDNGAFEDDEDKLDDLLVDSGDRGDDEDDEEVVVLGKNDIYATVALGIFLEINKFSVVHIKSSHVRTTASREKNSTYNIERPQLIANFNWYPSIRLVETIGRGSYGTVHKAINLSSGAAVAVKLIGKDKLRSPHERRSIEKEIETMRVAVEQFENGHPHIVRLLCTKESQQHIFIVLEYCAGGDLAAVMKASRGLSEVQSRVYLTQLASGLQFLHSQSVVHRDLKPANLLLSSKNEGTAKLKIADFGFARELQSESLAESVVGSPLYMAPELLEYKSYDAKADLWSVGIILYEMLVNDHPFLVVDGVHATNHLALRRNIHRYFERNPHVKLPSQIKVSEDCETLLRGLLRIDPRQRISFEDFFRAPFLLPPPPTETDLELTASASVNRQALVAEKQSEDDDLAFSDEYVIVDKEYEDVGRKILNQNDLKADMGVKANPVPARSRQTSGVDKVVDRVAELSVAPLPIPTTKDDRVAASSPPRPSPAAIDEMASIVDVVVDTSTPRASDATEHPGFDSPPTPESKQGEPILARAATPPPPVAAAINSVVTSTAPPRDWAVADETRLEELLGICYKSFSCGSVALFVPTPFGDYIAFHEGCPHYYLSIESVEAFKLEDGRNPPFVLGCIVFIEDFVASKDGNPYCLRDGTPYHIATATPLASHASSSAATSTPSEYGDLPMSQALAPRTLAFEPPPAPSSKPSSGFFSSLSSYLGHPTAAEPAPAPAPLPPPPQPHPQTQSSHVQNGSSTHHQRISFRSFQISHLALFFLKGGKQTYVAFNDGAPNYYLAHESIQAARDGNDDKTNPAYILGEIIFIDTFQATEDFNPYRLPYGTRFHVVTVANPTGT